MKSRARDAHVAEAVDKLSSPFRMKLLLLLLNVEKGLAVVEECCPRVYLFRRDFINELVGLILCYFDC